MTITASSFRLQFPPFADAGKYPGPEVDFYIGLAYKLLIADRWGDVIDYGAALFVAHFLALNKLAATQGTAGIPGTAIGILTSGSVDKVSYGRDVNSVMEDNAGHWNMTTYGMTFIRFARMMGTGPLQIGTPSPEDSQLSQSAWPGVIY